MNDRLAGLLMNAAWDDFKDEKIPPTLLIDNNNVGQFPNKLHY